MFFLTTRNSFFKFGNFSSIMTNITLIILHWNMKYNLLERDTKLFGEKYIVFA